MSFSSLVPFQHRHTPQRTYSTWHNWCWTPLAEEPRTPFLTGLCWPQASLCVWLPSVIMSRVGVGRRAGREAGCA